MLLFIKYVSDKYAGKIFGEVKIPEGSSFDDMVALKGKPDIGDRINKEIIAPLIKANQLSDMPDFNDAAIDRKMSPRWSDIDAALFASALMQTTVFSIVVEGISATLRHPVNLELDRFVAHKDAVLSDSVGVHRSSGNALERL